MLTASLARRLAAMRATTASTVSTRPSTTELSWRETPTGVNFSLLPREHLALRGPSSQATRSPRKVTPTL